MVNDLIPISHSGCQSFRGIHTLGCRSYIPEDQKSLSWRLFSARILHKKEWSSPWCRAARKRVKTTNKLQKNTSAPIFSNYSCPYWRFQVNIVGSHFWAVTHCSNSAVVFILGMEIQTSINESPTSTSRKAKFRACNRHRCKVLWQLEFHFHTHIDMWCKD